MAYNKNKSKFEKKDYKQDLNEKFISMTEQYIEQLESAGKWEKPWYVCTDFPKNPWTGTQYRGINIISLMTAGFDNPNFLTYLNVQEMEKTRQEAHTIITEASDKFKAGELSAMDYARDRAKAEKLFVKLEAAGMVDRDKPIHVQKGAISTPIFKAVDMEIDVQKTKRDENGNPITEDGMVVMEDGKAKIKVMAFSANVFNASQVANLKQVYEKTYDFEPHAEAEIHIKAMMEKTDLKIEHNAGGRAYYSVKEHKVVMPEKERFEPGAYYDTLFHEIGHSTGPALGRKFGGKFGDKEYAFEELVAELSSAFMSSEIGIPHNSSTHENHVAYLKSWLGALKEDKNFLFKAASQAQKSVDFQNFCRNEYKLENGLIKEQEQTQGKEQTSSPSIADKKMPVLKKQKQLSMSM